MQNNKKMYYSLVQNDNAAVINIFGDITSYAWEEYGEFSNVLLSKKLEELGNVSVIDVYINSYGGEVAEGLAIYNALKRHKAKIRTHVDGFACSIASVIFMAGDERIMPSASCLMIHNPWTRAVGNAQELRKQAEDLDTIGECSVNAYMEHINISKEELKELLDNEKWLSPDEAVEMGFATAKEEMEDNDYANQSIKEKVIGILLSKEKTDFKKEKKIITDESSLKTTETTVVLNNSNDVSDDPNLIEKNKNEALDKATKMMAAFFMSIEKEILK